MMIMVTTLTLIASRAVQKYRRHLACTDLSISIRVQLAEHMAADRFCVVQTVSVGTLIPRASVSV